jgi:hypothetical protein
MRGSDFREAMERVAESETTTKEPEDAALDELFGESKTTPKRHRN